MDLDEQIAELRAKPLQILCRTPAGLEVVMTIPECIESGSAYLHIVADELDALLSESLNAGISETTEATEGGAWYSGLNIVRTMRTFEDNDLKVRTRRKTARNGCTGRNC